jgi:hypothetical protein
MRWRARGQAFHQHAPALADLLLAADDPVHGDEDLAAFDGAVHEGGVHGPVPPADLHAGLRHRDERAGDAQVALAFGQGFVNRVEGQARPRWRRAPA